MENLKSIAIAYLNKAIPYAIGFLVGFAVGVWL